ncbi:hypothetical protein GUITHDRAFT_120443 [Guillardia theta CCMP2712]|uniref:RWP-RK domain-containing protein n=1 Tax=Guillardia theta (strain CCMP2712) TaxID=905079 RepID=L1IBT6_GUITC|nr:hypothetical protein GUITHDRAFT_120443 [Guillardia theta CCMP2712]EKX33379.1 hypothetical protein GUITHDRAFT_120443 [Guillardia theta CCMP2712]|eukprot:XP_005820359.1 hypothetical protein GUITHDRAFT_120443 [Guillardia theta CCMP2712]
MLGPKVARVFLRKRRGEAGEGDQQPSQKEILITNETIESLLHLRQVDAANQLGISLTALKNACKYLGFDDWPTARSNLMAAQHGRSGELPSLVSGPGQAGGPHAGGSSSVRQLVERRPGNVELAAAAAGRPEGGAAARNQVVRGSGQTARTMSEGDVGGGRGEKRRVLAESLPELRSHGLEELMLDALEHVAGV